MAKIGQFIYPWGNGHYSRMMRLNEKLKELGDNEFHYFSKGDIYKKLLRLDWGQIMFIPYWIP